MEHNCNNSNNPINLLFEKDKVYKSINSNNPINLLDLDSFKCYEKCCDTKCKVCLCVTPGEDWGEYLYWDGEKWNIGGGTVDNERIHLGANAGQINQGEESVAIGFQSGQSNQASQSIALGYQAGQFNQSSQAIAIGLQSGQSNQGSDGIALGTEAGQFNQASQAVAIGFQAGQFNQGFQAVAIGFEAGQFNQGFQAVAIGYQAGQSNQGSQAGAIGFQAGQFNQASQAIAIGTEAGITNQGENAIAIGYQAGQFNQGSYAIAIGYQAGITNQHANSIIINASTNPINSVDSNSFYLFPIREAPVLSTYRTLMWRPTNLDNTTNAEVVCSVNTTNQAKTFVIEHPVYSNYYLQHSCLEGPETGVYYRGNAEITNNSHVEIQLPDYVDKIASDFTVHINPISHVFYSTSRVKENKFTVKGENGEFSWSVYGKRNDLIVEPSKEDYTLKGDGPYTYLTKN